ncbi:hypothetical protein [Flavobacterium sp.]|jgi:hypothetical protein|uniref:hypothetical protein n=1 Tax=Flavobacterium sp. TaxID=239 RepID=UPI002A80F205|nr:hypothetical protein [Flavobacterium sp.]
MKKILSLLFIASIALACTDDDIKAEGNLAGGDKVVGFTPAIQTVPYFSDEGTVLRKFPLDLIGKGNGQYSTTDIEVAYSVNYAESTASEGVEFDFVGAQGATGNIVIPAGGSFGEFSLNVNTGSLDPVVKTELVLDLVSASPGSTVGAQYNKLRIIFVGCLSQIAGNYQVTISTVAGTSVRTNEVLTLTDINTFQTKYVGRYGFGTFTPAGFGFIDICGELSLKPDQTLGQYSNGVYSIDAYGDGIDGIVTSPTTLEIKHNIEFGSGDQKQNYSYVRN